MTGRGRGSAHRGLPGSRVGPTERCAAACVPGPRTPVRRRGHPAPCRSICEEDSGDDLRPASSRRSDKGAGRGPTPASPWGSLVVGGNAEAPRSGDMGSFRRSHHPRLGGSGGPHRQPRLRSAVHRICPSRAATARREAAPRPQASYLRMRSKPSRAPIRWLVVRCVSLPRSGPRRRAEGPPEIQPDRVGPIEEGATELDPNPPAGTSDREPIGLFA